MAGFDQGFGLGAQLHQQQVGIAQEAKIAQREERAKLYESALNNPNVSPGDRQQLMAGLSSLYAPHEAPSLIERLSGLIHGNTKAASKAQGETAQALIGAPNAPVAPGAGPAGMGTPQGLNPATATGPTVAGGAVGNAGGSGDFGIGSVPADAAHPLATGTPGQGGVPTPVDTAANDQPMHPFATQHPAISALQAGIDNIGAALKSHASGFAHPPGFNQPPQDDSALLARAYQSPEDVAVRTAQRTAAAQLSLQNARNAGLEAVANIRLGINPKNAYLNSYAHSLGFDSFGAAPQQVQNDALSGWTDATQHLQGVVQPDQNNPGQFVKHFERPTEGQDITTLPPRGDIPISSTSSRTDPLTGLTTTTNRTTTPIIPGAAKTAPVSANAPSAAPSAASLSNLASTVNSKRTSAATTPTAPRSSKSPGAAEVPLTADGTSIDPSYKGATANVISAANRIMAGTDVKEIHPPALAAQAETLAIKAGMDPQGTFTPLQNRQMNTSLHFINQAINSPQIFEPLNDLGSRSKLQALVGPPPQDFKALKAIVYDAASQHLTPAEDKFLQAYNTLVGTMSGLAPLVRSGRMTEAGIDRLINELPNPYTTPNSQGAIDRMKRLTEEIRVARQPYKNVQQDLNAASAPTSTNAPGQPEKEVRDKSGKLLGYTRDGKTFSRLP